MDKKSGKKKSGSHHLHPPSPTRLHLHPAHPNLHRIQTYRIQAYRIQTYPSASKPTASKSNAHKSTASVSASPAKSEFEQIQAFLNRAKDNEVEKIRGILEEKPKSTKSTNRYFQDEALANTRMAPNADKKKRKFNDDPFSLTGTLKTRGEISEANILVSDDNNEEQEEESDDQLEESDDQLEESDDQLEELDDQLDEPDDQLEEPDDQSEEPDDQPEEPDDQPPVEPKKKRRKGNDGLLEVTGDTINLISQAVADRMEAPKRRKGYILCY